MIRLSLPFWQDCSSATLYSCFCHLILQSYSHQNIPAMSIADSSGAPTRLEDYHPSRVLTLVYQPFAVGTMALLAYNEAKIDTRKRNLAGYIIFFLSTLALILIDLATSGKGGIGNYIAICVFVAAFGVADAHVQGGMVGDLSLMLPEFIQSFLAGLAASGALTSALRLMTKAAFEKSGNGLRKGTMLFLAISTFLEFLCIFLYAFMFPKLPIVKHFRAKAASEGSKTVSSDLVAAGIKTEASERAEVDAKCPERLSNKELLFQNIDYALDLYLIYVLTLSIFPGFLYENTGSHQLGSWYPLVLIASYNVWDLISRYIPLRECIKLQSRKGLMIAVLSRFLLVPAFYFTAKYGDQGWMILLTSFLGLTNGYLTVCVMTVAPKGYSGPEQNAVGNIMVLFLLGGIFSGVALDWLWLIVDVCYKTAYLILLFFLIVDLCYDLKGRNTAMTVCWILGLGSLLSWNSVLTIGDYYYVLFPLNLATSGKGGIGTFISICIFVSSFGVADALVKGGMVGDQSLMCPEFIQSFLAGMAASGALTTALSQKQYSRNQKMGLGRVQADDGAKPPKRLTNKQLFFENIDHTLDLFLTYFLTLSIFPGFLYENTESHQLGSWYPLVLIAMFYAWDLISRYIPIIKILHLESRKGLIIATMSRFLLIPAFYFAAKYGDPGWMIMLTSFLGLTNGYLTVCVFTSAPKGYMGPEQNALGNLLVLCLIVGIFSGVTLGWLWLIHHGKAYSFGSLLDSWPRLPCLVEQYVGNGELLLCIIPMSFLFCATETYSLITFPAKQYHPERVLTLVYLPFAFGTMAILAHNEAKINTRQRNLTGYVVFFASTLALLVLDLATSGKGGIGNYTAMTTKVVNHQRLSNKELFAQNIDYAAVLFFIYVLTLSIFPGFIFANTGSHQLGSWYQLVLIAMYNVMDLISRYIPLLETLELKSRKCLMIATLSRFLFVPAFYFTAKYGDQGWMILLTSFLGLTNGYLTVCVLTQAPKGYKGPEQNALGNLLVLCLLGGFATSFLSWDELRLSNHVNFTLLCIRRTNWNLAAAMTAGDSSVVPVRLEGKYAAMFVCWVLGLGALVAWNSMLTIGDYYYALFPNQSLRTSIGFLMQTYDLTSSSFCLKKYHPARVLTLVYQPFALGTMGFLAYTESNGNTRRRNLTGYILFFLSTFALVVLDLATSGKGGVGNYIGICIIVAVFGVADAHVEGGMVGDLSFMCPEFIQSFLAGLAASGALTSGLRLMTKAAFENSGNGLRKGTMLFLAISTFFEFICILLYAYVFAKLPIVKYYRSKAASEGSKTVSSDLAAAGIKTEASADDSERLSNKQLLFQNIDYALDLFLIYVLTLSIFPGFLYENTGSHQLGSWYPLVLIAMYNVFDLIARYIPLVQCLKLESRKGLLIAILSRFLLIPAFYFTAKYGDQGWMIMLTSFLGLTNGYLTVCVFTTAPKGYKGPEQNALGNLLVFFLLGGIFAGVALDWLWLIGNSHF
ncbi:hypothetical protein RJ639_021287 [Escallonia herrerae]|uniref:Equilibrative nucleoside transporter n=1 Tax=Escallonia herrerae TaxID=1293975 RepID=A0AA88V566_9ASTE|nr:hypothetical protein RJ639_021287 [Escallonia herrerae]